MSLSRRQFENHVVLRGNIYTVGIQRNKYRYENTLTQKTRHQLVTEVRLQVGGIGTRVSDRKT